MSDFDPCQHASSFERCCIYWDLLRAHQLIRGKPTIFTWFPCGFAACPAFHVHLYDIKVIIPVPVNEHMLIHPGNGQFLKGLAKYSLMLIHAVMEMFIHGEFLERCVDVVMKWCYEDVTPRRIMWGYMWGTKHQHTPSATMRCLPRQTQQTISPQHGPARHVPRLQPCSGPCFYPDRPSAKPRTRQATPRAVPKTRMRDYTAQQCFGRLAVTSRAQWWSSCLFHAILVCHATSAAHRVECQVFSTDRIWLQKVGITDTGKQALVGNVTAGPLGIKGITPAPAQCHTLMQPHLPRKAKWIKHQHTTHIFGLWKPSASQLQRATRPLFKHVSMMRPCSPPPSRQTCHGRPFKASMKKHVVFRALPSRQSPRLPHNRKATQANAVLSKHANVFRVAASQEVKLLWKYVVQRSCGGLMLGRSDVVKKWN